ncbi:MULTISPECIES: FlhC family transcriptional regulator [unclassified Paraburkholderia]|uniref:FlhC family transcriptional regulator n=1 Tax=unclassified Paraburkholderia TaxID=2615204 RepID=UPI002AB2DB98|nr:MULTISPECIES: FlhC family transcriptional regulator [unclassified Paraburkholderia]
MIANGNAPTLNERIARVLIAAGTRRPVVRSISRVPEPLIDQMYTEELGRQSTSGQLPSSLEWFTKSHRIQIHGAFVLLAYRRITQSLRGPAFDGLLPRQKKEVAFTRTLTYYQEICGGADKTVVSSQRLYTLLGTFGDARQISERGNEAAEIKLHFCASCKVPLIIPRDYLEYHCGECKPNARRGQRHPS